MAFIRFSTALKTARATTLVTAAGANATIKFYTGSAPANVDTAVTGTLLGTLTCGSTLGTVSNGVLTFGAITGDSSVDATGAWGYPALPARACTGDKVGLDHDGIVAGDRVPERLALGSGHPRRLMDALNGRGIDDVGDERGRPTFGLPTPRGRVSVVQVFGDVACPETIGRQLVDELDDLDPVRNGDPFVPLDSNPARRPLRHGSSGLRRFPPTPGKPVLGPLGFLLALRPRQFGLHQDFHDFHHVLSKRCPAVATGAVHDRDVDPESADVL